jgi:peptidoglycan/LPS O-acetylase OafA/YrhL
MSRSDFQQPGELSYVPELDGLRALACFGVLVARYNPIVTHQSPFWGLFRDSSPGNIGVMLFFSLPHLDATSRVV